TKAAPIEFRIRTKQGKIRWLNHVCQPVFDEKGNYLGNRGTNRNITVQKLSQLALTESEMRFKEIADLAFEGIVIHHDGIAENINKAFMIMSGYSETELLGKNIIEFLFTEDTKPQIWDNIKNLRALKFEAELIRKDCNAIPVEI